MDPEPVDWGPGWRLELATVAERAKEFRAMLYSNVDSDPRWERFSL
jgi:hypothetical protein